MSAGILSTDNMVYVSNEGNGRFVPWHKMGVPLEIAPSSKEALVAAGLDWKVNKKDVYVDGNLQEHYKATVRDVDGMTLGIVSDRYKIVQNEDAFSFVDDIVDGKKTKYETAGSLWDGRMVWMLAKLPSYSILGDEIDQFVCFTNTHDGTGSVKVFTTPVRVVCNNTLNYALGGAKRSWYCTHAGDVTNKLEAARDTLSNVQAYRDAQIKDANALAAKKFTETEIAKIIMQLIPDPEPNATDRQKDNVSLARSKFVNCLKMDDLQNHKNNGWGIVNAAADYAAHVVLVNRDPYVSTSRFSSVMFRNSFLDDARKIVLAA